MGDGRGFVSLYSCHHLGIFLGPLTATLLVVGTCTQAQAEKNSVSITIHEPSLKNESEKEYFGELRDLILESFEDALLENYVVPEDGDKAYFGIDLNITGPFNGCYWRVKCKWSEKSNNKKHKCWDKAANVTWCDTSTIAEMNEIGCLGNIVDFTAHSPPTLPKPLCKTNENIYKFVHTACFNACLSG